MYRASPLIVFLFLASLSISHASNKKRVTSSNTHINPRLFSEIVSRRDLYFIRVGRLMMSNSALFGSYLNRRKNGAKSPSVPTLIKAAENLGRQLDRLIWHAPPKTQTSLEGIIRKIHREDLWRKATKEFHNIEFSHQDKTMVENTLIETWRFGPILKTEWKNKNSETTWQ